MDEIGTAPTWWRKSSYSGGDNNCVEVAATGTCIGVRDTKRRHGDVLRFSPGAWQAFTAALRGPSSRRDPVR
jgi:Domain of unknown function (DUF397)